MPEAGGADEVSFQNKKRMRFRPGKSLRKNSNLHTRKPDVAQMATEENLTAETSKARPTADAGGQLE